MHTNIYTHIVIHTYTYKYAYMHKLADTYMYIKRIREVGRETQLQSGGTDVHYAVSFPFASEFVVSINLISLWRG